MSGDRRPFTLALVLVALACGQRAETARQNAPVIIISVDTLRSDRLPAYGYSKVATPNIDALARDSVIFERAYSQCPMTLPAHLSVFTGLLPTEHGVRNNIGYRFDRDKFRTLAEILRDRGYSTAAAVSSYVLRSETGSDDGFDVYDDEISIATAGATSEHQRSGFATLRSAARWIAANSSRPFFYFFHIYEPHAPYTPPEPFRGRYSDPYDGEIAASDAIVGDFVQSLKTAGVYEAAIIVFLSDHGEGLWDHGEDQHGILLYRESLQVPLFVKLPRSVRAGTRNPNPVALTRVFDTVLDLVGERAENRRSLLGETDDAPIYSETLYPRIHLGWSELRSMIAGRHHYISSSSPELYDLVNDPAEKKNIINDERRVAAALNKIITAMPAGSTEVTQIDPEDAAKLAALGYIGTPQNRTGPLPNPRDVIGDLEKIRAAFLLAEQRRFREAIPALRALVDRNPALLDVQTRLGEVLTEQGDYGGAIRVYDAALRESARMSPELILSLAAVYLKAGRLDEAERHTSAALESSPREAHELLARIALQRGDLAAAERQVRTALDAGERQPATLLILAEIHRAAGRLDHALSAVEEAESRVSPLFGAQHLRADLLARMDRPDDAISAYRREIQNFPHHLQSYANLAVIYMIQENRGAAQQVLQDMAKKNPHRGAYELAATTLEAFGDRRGAARWRDVG